MIKTAVTTRSFDNTRRNVNLNETQLTPAALRQQGIRRLHSLALPDDARGTEGMPLIVPDVHIAGRATETVYACSMGNNVYAWNAQDGTLLWTRHLGTPIRSIQAIDAWLVNDHWGVVSTPVIDLTAHVLYCVSWTSPDGTPDTATFSLHGLSLIDGTPASKTLSLEGVTYSPHDGLPMQQFHAARRKQRCALTLTDVDGIKTVFVAAGSISESLASNRGWVIAIDVTDSRQPRITTAWSSTVRHSGAGIWMAGQGPAAIGHKLYLMTGNGAFDGVSEFGESFVELTYTPPLPHQAPSLRCTDHFSPFSDAGRDGQDPTKANLGRTGEDRPSNTNEWTDMDLGSGGLVVVPELGYGIGAGKDGIAYVLKLGNFGKTMPGDFAPERIGLNYARCASPPLWFTYYNPDVSASATRLTELNVAYGGVTHHQHSTPIVYNSSVYGWMVFTWGENGNLRAWSLETDGRLKYLARSAEVASPKCGPPGGMPGGMITLSANGSEPGTAVIWACVPYGDANKGDAIEGGGTTGVTNGRFIAYDAEDFGKFPDGDAQLVPVWDSERWNTQFMHNKFNIPVAANGRVYVPTYNGTIDVYG